MTQGYTLLDSTNKPDTDNDDSKQKDKSPKAETSPHADHSPTASGQPAYVPYALYNKLLERVSIKIIHVLLNFHFNTLHVRARIRDINLNSFNKVAVLEEKQVVLQGTIEQLSEQLVPLLANASINNKV